uniref:Uncharacterized protein n=1 Tax=Anguilla anguilla TaxID=7936 RepID=A0A0E9UJ70_ANGAN
MIPKCDCAPVKGREEQPEFGSHQISTRPFSRLDPIPACSGREAGILYPGQVAN